MSCNCEYCESGLEYNPYKQTFINPANYTNNEMSAVTTTEQTKKTPRVLTPTQLKLKAIQEKANAEKATIKSEGFRSDLLRACRENLPDDKLYSYVSAYKNNQDRIRKLTGVAGRRGAPKKNQE